MNRSIVVYLLIAALCAPLFYSCKKGENDPIFSFRTRKARLSQDWKVSFAEYGIDDTTWRYDGTTLIKYVNNNEQHRVKVEHTWSFTKNGDYSVRRNTTYPEGHFGPQTPELTHNYLETGIWNFTGGAGDTKTKSQLLLQEQRTENRVEGLDEVDASTFINPFYGKVMNLDMLKSKEMRWMYDYTENLPTGKKREFGVWEFERN